MNVDNFFFGVQASLSSVIDAFRIISKYPMFIGFLVGYFAASVVYAMMTADHVKHVPTMVLEDPSVSFSKVHPPKNDGTFSHGYADYLKSVERMKTIFHVIGFLFIALLMLVSLALK